jgi:hypothetical protein
MSASLLLSLFVFLLSAAALALSFMAKGGM